MAVSGARSNRENGDRIEPSRAAAALQRWRRSLAAAKGQDPGAPLDQPDRRLVMLRIFGCTHRLSELCMSHPDAASSSLLDGPSSVLAEAARDLAGLNGGVGGPDALHAALTPLKNRADIAIAIAELSGHWNVTEATAARVDFAERLVEAAMQWLVHAAIKRGELSVHDADKLTAGVCVIAGGDFAHEDLAPYGPLDIIILYDEQIFSGPQARGADRIFVRIGAEFREAFEGKPGEYPLFALRTPLGSGVGGAGFADSMARVKSAVAAPQSHALRMWLATARVVAGDRQSGGQFLETMEEAAWGETPILSDELRAALTKEAKDPRTVYRRIADLCRLAIGGARPVFRTASARQVFETAAKSGALGKDAMRRLVAGEELAQIAVSRGQMLKGGAIEELTREDERAALSILCGYPDYDALATALQGFHADAQTTLRKMMYGPQDEVKRYKSSEEGDPDAEKLKDLGFFNGESLSASVDKWAQRAAGNCGVERFSHHAPGLLTAFGETQKPNLAVDLFDQLIANAQDEDTIFSVVTKEGPQRDALVDAIGCFSGAVAPLVGEAALIKRLADLANEQAPQSGEEWLARMMPPSTKNVKNADLLIAWRQECIAHIAASLAAGATSFNAAAEALEDVHIRTLTDLFEINRNIAPKEEAAASKNIALHVFDGSGAHLPGAATYLGFIAKEDFANAGEAFVKRYLDMLGSFGEGVFAITPDTTHRPAGVAGVLAPTLAQFKSYVQSEAVAYDQIMLARGRVIAGHDDICKSAKEALRGAVSGARRADILFRDLDRARAQRMRRERAQSEWDIDRLEGGRTDVELVISALIFRHAPAHPFVQGTRIDAALEAMARSDLISNDIAQSLIAARNFWTRLQVVRALAQWCDPVRDPVRPRFGEVIARAAGVDKFEQVRPLMRGYSEEVSRLYAQLVLNRPALSLVAEAAG